MLRAVVFDMDGLMFNSEDVYTLTGTELLARRGHRFTRELKAEMMGLPAPLAFGAMIARHGLTEPWQELSVESNEIYLSLLHKHLAPMPGLMDLLDALEKAKLPKAIATSSVLSLVDECLAPYKLKPRFQFILTADDIVHGKPHPDIYLLAASRFGIDPKEMLVLEDSRNGCLAARAAGAYTVAVPGVHGEGLDYSMADMVLASLEERRLYEVLKLK
jgi:HAD superfamily hydrolase (TIGR01509 family)